MVLLMKKEILFIIPQFNIGGGAERATSLIANKLSENYRITILTFLNYKNLYSHEGKHYSLKENVGFFNKFLMFLKINQILRPMRIYKLINFISPDIIISFMDFANISTIIAKLLFRIKIPLIISVRSNPKKIYKKKNRHMNILIRLLYRLNSVNKIVTVSKELRNILAKEYNIPKSKTIHIHNGIDSEEINKMKNESILIHKDLFNNHKIFKFITVGRLHEIKGHKYLIEAFSKVKNELSDSKLFIIGTGPLKEELETMIKEKDLTEDVLLLGLVKNPFKYLAKSDAFIFSSLHEGFPNALIEALVCGVPIISTNCETGPKEILDNGKYGYLVNVEDTQDLAEKMVLFAKNSRYLQEFQKGSTQRAKFFDINKIINEWRELISDFC